MPPVRALPAPKRSTGLSVEALLDWAREEMSNPGKRDANIKILRAITVFAAGVIISRSYGEYLFVG